MKPWPLSRSLMSMGATVPAAAGGGGSAASWFATPPPGSGLRSDAGLSVGVAFTVSSTVTVSELGRLFVSGNVADHGVKLWDAANTTTPLVSATILAASASDAAGMKWVSITPVVLTAGNSYRLAVVENSSGQDWMTQWTPSLVSQFADVNSCYTTMPGDYPSNDGAGGTMYSSPGIKFV